MPFVKFTCLTAGPVLSVRPTLYRPQAPAQMGGNINSPLATLFVRIKRKAHSGIEVCMGMGKTGIPWVPWDSHGNGNTISHGNGN